MIVAFVFSQVMHAGCHPAKHGMSSALHLGWTRHGFTYLFFFFEHFFLPELHLDLEQQISLSHYIHTLQSFRIPQMIANWIIVNEIKSRCSFWRNYL